MWIIIDNNQVGMFAPSKCVSRLGPKFKGIVLSPSILTEVLLRSNSAPARRWLQKFHSLRLGLTVPEVFEKVAQSSEDQIPKVRPFAHPKSSFHSLLKEGLVRPSDELMEWAQKNKENHRHFTAKLAEAVPDILAKLKQARREGSKIKSKFRDMCDALVDLGNGPNSFLGSIVTTHVTMGSRIPVCSNPKRLFDAIMENQYLRGYFRAQFYYTLSITHAWEGRGHNRKPKRGHDDMTDLCLLLYAGINDRIVTADGMLKRMVPWIEPSGRPSVMTF